jgi:hypothetical protein
MRAKVFNTNSIGPMVPTRVENAAENAGIAVTKGYSEHAAKACSHETYSKINRFETWIVCVHGTRVLQGRID